MNTLMWDLVQSNWVWVVIGLMLLVLIAAALGTDDDDYPDDEEDARDDSGDHSHDQCVAAWMGAF